MTNWTSLLPTLIQPTRIWQILQMVTDPDNSKKLTQEQIRRIQGLVGSLLYYSLSSQHWTKYEQNKPVPQRTPKAKQINFLIMQQHMRLHCSISMQATWSCTWSQMQHTLCYQAQVKYSQIFLPLQCPTIQWKCYRIATMQWAHTHKRILLHITLWAKPKWLLIRIASWCNGPIHIVCKTFCQVVASAAKAETTALLFLNAQEPIPIRYLLEQLSHKQPPTPTPTKQTTPQHQYHSPTKISVRKGAKLGIWYIFGCVLGSENDADYFTEHHPTKHHLLNRHKLHSVDWLFKEP